MKTVQTTGRDREGNEGDLTLRVEAPSGATRSRAQVYRAKVYGEALDAGAKMSQQIQALLRRARLWDDDMERRHDELRRKILDGEKLLETKRHPDGKPVRLREAKEVALSISHARADLQALLSVGNEARANTADALASQAEFNFFVANCTVYVGGKWDGYPYFTRDGLTPSVDAYLERSDEKAARDAASALADLLYGTELEILSRLPEYVFLKKYNFVDDKLRLIDEQGRLVDEKGRLVNEDGLLVDGEGHLVDADGNRRAEDGSYLPEEGASFLDDDGNPVD